MARELLAHDVPPEILISLRDATMIGPSDRRLAAKLLRDCLTRKQDVASCLDFLKREELKEFAEAVTDLANDIGLIGKSEGS
jgi:hypothetical protein